MDLYKKIKKLAKFLSLQPKTVKEFPDLRPAAVLIPIIIKENEFFLLFTKRTEKLEHHKGQISFPGGLIEPGDSSPEATALREAHEEIGLSGNKVKIIGCLEQYPTTSNFLVTPVIGLIDEPIDLTPNPDEVEEIFYIKYSDLIKEKNKEIVQWKYKEKYYPVVFYHTQNCDIWGVTGAILENFITIFENI